MFRRSGETVHPIALNTFKNFLALGLFLPTIKLFGDPLLLDAPVSEYALLFLSGILGIGVADTLFFHSLNRLGAGLSAIVSCFYSPSLILLSVLLLDEVLTPLQVVGAALVVSAIVTATRPSHAENISRRDLALGVFLGIASLMLMAVSIVSVKPLLDRSPMLWVTVLRLMGGSAALIVALLLNPRRAAIIGTLLKSGGWKYTLTGSFFGGYISMALWVAGMKFTQVSTASVLNQTSNIFVFVFAALILKERITTRRAIGIGLAVSGAILVSFAR